VKSCHWVLELSGEASGYERGIRPKLCLVLDVFRLEFFSLVMGGAEVTYVFERVGVGFGVVLEEVARHGLILDSRAVVLHFVWVGVRSVSE
jgi:hypothetical protein